jgi:translation initiation factor 1
MKKLNSLSELKSFVDPSESLSNNSSPHPLSPFVKQYLEAHYSKKGRAGKPVTIIKCFKGNKNEMKELAKILKNKCGVGGSVKNEQIIIQGEFRDKITSILINMGHSVKRIGG